MTIIKTLVTSLAIVGMGVSSTAFADTRSGDTAPRISVLSKVSAAPKISRRNAKHTVAGEYAGYDGNGGGYALAGLAGLAIGAGGCVAAKCYGHTSP